MNPILLAVLAVGVLVSKYLGLSEKQTLQTWTVVSGVVGATGFAVVA